MEEINDLEELLETQDATLAIDRINSSFPVLRELASFIASGGKIPKPPGRFVYVIASTHLNFIQKSV